LRFFFALVEREKETQNCRRLTDDYVVKPVPNTLIRAIVANETFDLWHLDNRRLMKYICANPLLTVSNQQFVWTQNRQ
jgi:hypothetical protein